MLVEGCVKQTSISYMQAGCNVDPVNDDSKVMTCISPTLVSSVQHYGLPRASRFRRTTDDLIDDPRPEDEGSG